MDREIKNKINDIIVNLKEDETTSRKAAKGIMGLTTDADNNPTVVGGVKGEDRKENTHPCLVDLIRIGIISGSSIHCNKYDGVIGVHIVGVQMTFYIISLMSCGLYVMMNSAAFGILIDSNGKSRKQICNIVYNHTS
jgi:hypothetical protein